MITQKYKPQGEISGFSVPTKSSHSCLATTPCCSILLYQRVPFSSIDIPQSLIICRLHDPPLCCSTLIQVLQTDRSHAAQPKQMQCFRIGFTKQWLCVCLSFSTFWKAVTESPWCYPSRLHLQFLFLSSKLVKASSALHPRRISWLLPALDSRLALMKICTILHDHSPVITVQSHCFHVPFERH